MKITHAEFKNDRHTTVRGVAITRGPLCKRYKGMTSETNFDAET